jgi:biotin transport system substrate-specific component
MTLQLAAVLLAGLMLPPGRAFLAMAMYLGLGAAGLPVFAPYSAGLAGSTGGYLAGFAVGAWLVGVLRGPRDAGIIRLFLAGAAGAVSILACGVIWRLALLGAGGGIELVLATSLFPFLPKALVEAGCAAALVRAWRGRGGNRVTSG